MIKTRQDSKIEIWGSRYINGIRTPADANKEIIQIEAADNNNFIVEVVEKETQENKTKIQELQEAIEFLERRLKHLLSSDVIRQYDEYDRQTGTYARDISKFDKKYKKYKSAYNALLKPYISPEANGEFEKP